MSTPARRTPFVLLLLGLVVGGLCALLALNTASAANEVDRHDLAQKDQSIAAQLVQLNNERRASAAPANLAAAAEQLGMVPQGTPGFIELDANGHAQVKGKAAPATAPPPPVSPKPPAHSAHKKTAHKKTTKKTAQKKTTTKKTTKTKKTPPKHPTTQQHKKKTAKHKTTKKRHGTGKKHGGTT